MPKFNVTLTRQVVFTRTIEVEADDEDEAIEQAEEECGDEDGVHDNEDWEPGPVNHYGAPDVEEIEDEDDPDDAYDDNGNLRAGDN